MAHQAGFAGAQIAVQRDHQFAEVFAVFAGLHHRRAAVDENRHGEFGVTVAADDDIDPRHGLGQRHILAAGEVPVLILL